MDNLNQNSIVKTKKINNKKSWLQHIPDFENKQHKIYET
jgi:hypothetical protein